MRRAGIAAVFIMMILGFVLGAEAKETAYFTLDVAPEHRVCANDAECRYIETNCSGCGCGVAAVRYDFLEKYQQGRRDLCANYPGGVCDSRCPRTIPVCSNGLCDVIAPKVETAPSKEAADRIAVVEEDRKCRQDLDCVIILDECGACSCGDAVSASAREKYVAMYQKQCEGFGGAHCEIDCAVVAICQDGQCVRRPSRGSAVQR